MKFKRLATTFVLVASATLLPAACGSSKSGHAQKSCSACAGQGAGGNAEAGHEGGQSAGGTGGQAGDASISDASAGAGGDAAIDAPVTDDAGRVCTTVDGSSVYATLDMFIVLLHDDNYPYSLLLGTDAGQDWSYFLDTLTDLAAYNVGSVGFRLTPSPTGTCQPASYYATPTIPFGAATFKSLKSMIQQLKAAPPGQPADITDALDGAYSYAGSWANAHPQHRVIVVLVSTVGQWGEACTGDTAAAAEAAAAAAYAGPHQIATYVFDAAGVGGDLYGIAKAGGGKMFGVYAGERLQFDKLVPDALRCGM